MKIVAISDTHCRHKSLILPKGDILIHAGDLTYKGEPSEVTDFLGWFAKLPFPYKIFIAGNHDFYFEKASQVSLKAIIPGNIIYLKDSGIAINGLNFWGTPVTPWFYNWAFNRNRGEAINKHWMLIPQHTDVLITHGPAFGILDSVINGQLAGDKDLLKRLAVISPKLHVCGHIHEAYGKLKRGGTNHINASVLNEHYELVNPPVVFEI